MKQKFILALAVICLLSTKTFSQERKKVSPLFTTLYADYTISEISVANNIDIVLIQGSEEDLRMSASENTFNKLYMDVKGATLFLAPKANLLNDERVAVFITVSDLKRLNLSGNAFATSRGKLASRNLTVTIEGNAKLQLGSSGNVTVETPDNYQVLKEKQFVQAFALNKI